MAYDDSITFRKLSNLAVNKMLPRRLSEFWLRRRFPGVNRSLIDSMSGQVTSVAYRHEASSEVERTGHMQRRVLRGSNPMIIQRKTKTNDYVTNIIITINYFYFLSLIFWKQAAHLSPNFRSKWCLITVNNITSFPFLCAVSTADWPLRLQDNHFGKCFCAQTYELPIIL